MISAPLLLILFNRPEKTAALLNSIRHVGFSKLYIAADGPRINNDNDIIACGQVRDLVRNEKWNCDVQYLFQDENKGCKNGVSTAINWFFENEEKGIILEDDIEPSLDFFIFCDELLNKYKDDDRVGMISGSNLVGDRFQIQCSYAFCCYPNVWGWASWRRAWNSFDVEISDWPKWMNSNNFRKVSGNSRIFQYYWIDILNAVQRGEIDTWDFQWFYAIWKTESLCIIPAVNLVRNIGFDSQATHTDGVIPDYILTNPIGKLSDNIVHPNEVKRNIDLDVIISKYIFKISIYRILKNKLRRYPFVGDLLSGIRRKLQELV